MLSVLIMSLFLMKCKNPDSSSQKETKDTTQSLRASSSDTLNGCYEEFFLMVDEVQQKCVEAKTNCEIESLIQEGYVKLPNSMIFNSNFKATTCDSIDWEVGE